MAKSCLNTAWSWGLATAVKDGVPSSDYYLNHGVTSGISFEHTPFDEANYEAACQFLGIEKLDFDTFNEQFNGLTKAQYLDYVQPKK